MGSPPPYLKLGVSSRLRLFHVVLFIVSLIMVEGVLVRVVIIVPVENGGTKWEVLGLNVTMDALVDHLNVL